MPLSMNSANSPRVRCLALDFGGVVTWDVWEHVYLEGPTSLAERYRFPPDALRTIGKELWSRYAFIMPTSGRDWQKLEREYWTEFNLRMNAKIPVEDLIVAGASYIRWVDGMESFLSSLNRDKLILAACTNNTAFWLQRQVSVLGLHRFFKPELIVASCDVGVSKSSTKHEMFARLIERCGCTPHECLFVDDRHSNITRAEQFGIRALLVPTHSPLAAGSIQHQLDISG